MVLQIEGLTFHYPQRELFTGLSAHVPRGVTLVTGGDGAGKTTLLRLLAGDLKPQAGRVDSQPRCSGQTREQRTLRVVEGQPLNLQRHGRT